jgi:hypothetical protein
MASDIFKLLKLLCCICISRKLQFSQLMDKVKDHRSPCHNDARTESPRSITSNSLGYVLSCLFISTAQNKFIKVYKVVSEHIDFLLT